MSATTSIVQTGRTNRRRRVRHKIQTPAYAIFTPESQSAMLDLHEIVDISEDGMSIQCHSPLRLESTLHVALDLAECPKQIHTIGRVIWANDSGRVGFRFSELRGESLARLREWLFVNVMAGVANGEAEIAAYNSSKNAAPPSPSYTDKLEAAAAVQRQVEALGSDLKSALRLIAERAQTLSGATGAAIALADADPNFMVCRASSGPDSPPLGVRLEVGSGFSGECVKKGTLLRCDDTEVDDRVNRENCRALGIRSILAMPVRAGTESVGLIEIFSPLPDRFTTAEGTLLERLAEMMLASANRAAIAANLPPLGPPPEAPFTPKGSVLFAAADQEEHRQAEEKKSAGITLPRSHLILLYCAAAAISLGLGTGLAPWIQSEALPRLAAKFHTRDPQLPTVLASSRAPASPTISPAIETATIPQLRQMAQDGSPDAQNALGLRYATGEGVVLNESEAVRWFTQAAEQGNVAAQSKLGSIYYSGRGVRQDAREAYFWIVVARSGGDAASKALAPFVGALLTHSQASAIELDADQWLQQHSHSPKPAAGQLKAKF